MLTVKMAIRNVFRYKRRTLITAIAIAVGVMFGIFMDGFVAGMDNQSIRNLRDFETGDVRLYPEGYFVNRDFLPFDRFIEPEDRKLIEAAYTGTKIVSRVNLAAELHFTEEFFEIPGSVNAQVSAVNPVKDGSVFLTSGKVTDGRWLEPSDAGIVMGSWLADDIGAKVGAVVGVECKGRGGFYQTFDAEIVGILLTDDPMVNKNGVFMDLSVADELLSLGGAVTEYTIRFDSTDRFGKKFAGAKKTLSESGAKGVELYAWDEVAASVLQMQKAEGGENKVFLFFIYLIAAVGITNTMMMAVIERRHEVGMLRALGFTAVKIRLLFLVEGFGIGLVGCLAGLVPGCLLNWYMVVFGLDFSSMIRGIEMGYRITGVFHSVWNVGGIARTLGGSLLIATAVAWFPSGKILKKEVAEILR